MGRAVFPLLRGATLSLLAACSSLEPSSDSYQSLQAARDGAPDADAGADAGGQSTPGAWTCDLVHPKPIPIAISSPPPAKVHYRLGIGDFVTLQAIPGLTLTACLIADFSCGTPVNAVYSVPFPSHPAINQIEVPFGFDGYLRMTAPNYPPSEYYFGGALEGSRTSTMDDGVPLINGEPLGIPSLSEVADFFKQGAAGAMPDPNKGFLNVRTIDCNGARAAGVSLLLDPNSGIPYTLLQNIPVYTSPPSPTDSRGSAGSANVDPGNYVVSGMPPAGVLPSGMSYGNRSVRIRAGYLTIAEIRADDYSYGR